MLSFPNFFPARLHSRRFLITRFGDARTATYFWLGVAGANEFENAVEREMHIYWEGFTEEDKGKKPLPVNVQKEIVVHSQERQFFYRSRAPLQTGWISGEQQSLIDILDQGTNWTCKSVSRYGFDCQQVSVEHPNGSFSVVFRSDQSFSVMEIVVKKNGNQKHRGDKLVESGITDYVRTYRYRDFDPEFKKCVVESFGAIIRNGKEEVTHRIRYWEFRVRKSNRRPSPQPNVPMTRITTVESMRFTAQLVH